MPSDVRIEAEEFENESQRNPDFVNAVKTVKSD